MDAKMYALKLEEIAPSICDLQRSGLSENGSKEIIKEWILIKKGVKDIEDSILDLVYNYNTVDIGVGTITIDDKVEKIKNFIFLVILKAIF